MKKSLEEEKSRITVDFGELMVLDNGKMGLLIRKRDGKLLKLNKNNAKKLEKG